MSGFRIGFFIYVFILLSACDRGPSSANDSTSAGDNSFAQAGTNFSDIVGRYLDEYWQLHPTSALYAGLYQFDTQLLVPDEKLRQQRKALAKATIELLEGLDGTDLNNSDKTDRLILLNRLRYGLWNDEVLQAWRWDPSNYNVAGGFGLILNTEYKPLTERLDVFYQRLQNVPAYYAAARANIVEPTLEHLELAIQQNQGAISLLQERFVEQARGAEVDADTIDRYQQKATLAVLAIEEYVAYLHNLREALQQGEGGEKFRDFRLGKDLFAEKFQRQLVTDFSADEVYQLAIARKQALHQEMKDITNTLWPKYFADTPQPQDSLTTVGMMIKVVAQQHTDKDNFVAEVHQQIADLENFVVEKDLLALDPDKPLVVREMPAYQRGIAIASIESPGPYDSTANTYYNVVPLDNYSEQEAESLLREYNDRTLQILNIHEAIPGHYAQLVHANKSNSLIKSLFGNGAMVEGWAVYAEHMMMEAGYGNNEPELRLMYNKWLLRAVINAIIDHDIHCNNLSEAETFALLVNEGFQEEAEATGKWRRATLSQVQLSSYFTGYSEILAFREQIKKEQDENFNLKNFHHQFLGYGSAPVPIIKQLMGAM